MRCNGFPPIRERVPELLTDAANPERPLPGRLRAFDELLERLGTFTEPERFEFGRARAELVAALERSGPVAAGPILYRAEDGRIVRSLPWWEGASGEKGAGSGERRPDQTGSDQVPPSSLPAPKKGVAP